MNILDSEDSRKFILDLPPHDLHEHIHEKFDGTEIYGYSKRDTSNVTLYINDTFVSLSYYPISTVEVPDEDIDDISSEDYCEGDNTLILVNNGDKYAVKKTFKRIMFEE